MVLKDEISQAYKTLLDEISSLFVKSLLRSELKKQIRRIHLSTEERAISLRNLKFKLSECDLTLLSKSERIYLMDTVIKTGYLELVKPLCERFIELDLEDDIKIPSRENPEVPYRPTFWLASIVTRQPYATKENYEAITFYLCGMFNIPQYVKIKFDDRFQCRNSFEKLVNKKEYCLVIDKWKHAENYRLCFSETKYTLFYKDSPRFRRHELMDEIEKRQGKPLQRK